MKENSVLGQRAEQMVAETLRKNGAIISKMNYRSKYGEIDIVAETHKYLIFVEVKLRKKDSLVSPGQAVDANKQRRIILTAKDYIVKSQSCDILKTRFDVAEVIYDIDSQGKIVYNLNYIKNAF